MSGSIFRYEVAVNDKPQEFWLSGDPLAVGSRTPAVVEFWAVYDQDVAGQLRRFLVVGTGQGDLPDRWAHIGTTFAADGRLVWHLIEVLP